VTIRTLSFGVLIDTDVPQHMVRVEHEYPARLRDASLSTAEPLARLWVMAEDARAAPLDRFRAASDGLYKLPYELTALAYIPEDLVDVITGLRLEDPCLGEYCQAPGCVLPTERVVHGYGLCWHHRERIAGCEVLLIPRTSARQRASSASRK
jgi:hypothetical protein